MNLSNHPTAAQLSALLATANDAASSHILWVHENGDVFITPLPKNLSSGDWATRNSSQMRFRYETYDQGNDYVGANAAEDEDYVNELFQSLIQDWEAGRRGYLDYD